MSNIYRPFFSKRGFTLIELLIVIVIIGIIATIAVPVYDKMIWRGRFAEVYNIVGIIARAEHMYYTEHGNYTRPALADCFAGKDITTGSTQVQKDLNIDIPSSCFFRYLIYPSTAVPVTYTRIYFRDLEYLSYAWVYDYVTGQWDRYTPGDDNGGPAELYFVPPAD